MTPRGLVFDTETGVDGSAAVTGQAVSMDISR